MSTRIQVRRDTTANWTTYQTSVPAQGEFCYDTQAHTLKIGDGTTSYANLKIIGDGDTDISDYVSKTATASQNIESELTFKSGKATIYDDGSADFSNYNHLLNLDGSYDSSHLTNPADVNTYLGGAGFFNTGGNNEAIYVSDSSYNTTVKITHSGSAEFAGNITSDSFIGSDRTSSSQACFVGELNGAQTYRVNADGTVKLGNTTASPNTTLNGNGSAEFAGSVKSNDYLWAIPKPDNAGLYLGGDNTANPRAVIVQENGSQGFNNIELNWDGSATFRGNLVNGTASSYIGTYANTNNGAVLYGVLSNAEKWRISGNGSATFAGDVIIGDGGVVSTNNNVGVSLYKSGNVYARTALGTQSVFVGFNGNTVTSNIKGNGSAEFANVTADYYFAVRDTTNEDYLSLQTGNNNGVKVLHKGTGIFIGSNLTNVNASVPTGTQTKLLTDGSATFASAVTANNVITRLYSASQYLYLGSANDVLFYRHDGTSSGQQQVKIARTGNASFAGTVSAQGSVLTSDARFKTNIEPAGSQLSDVVQLGNLLKNWNWKEDAPVADKDIRFLGLVAQDVATVCPGIVKTIDRTKQGAELTPEKVVPAVYEEQVIPAVYKEQIIPAEYKTILVPAEVDDEGNKISPPKTEKVLVTPEQTEQVLVTPEQTKQVLVKEEEVIPATYEELDDSYKGIKNDVLVMKLLGAVAELSAKVAALEAA